MAPKKPFFVGIAGGTGSGKTTVARRLKSALPESAAVLIDHDAYYKDRSNLPRNERDLLNFDHPDALDNDLLVRHLDDLRAGLSIEMPLYDFVAHSRRRESKRVGPVPIVIVEGILIFVDTDADIRVFRRVRRDMMTRGRTFEQVDEQYHRTVRPMHLEFVEPSKRWADILIPEGGNNEVALDLVISKLLTLADR